eukprot:TRINITY_DN14958_c0_g2_i2.p1 TRINITY_DN14958_c0_g2~~TRINITY_DN14958_c0_g2_i2.p1  ORF type:complete len:365 (-),score=51.18 TRINITY_DN14958_c0_g2_i2:102-1196(-)
MFVPSKMAPVKFAFRRFADSTSALLRLHSRRLPPSMFARTSAAPVRSARSSCALFRFFPAQSTAPRLLPQREPFATQASTSMQLNRESRTLRYQRRVRDSRFSCMDVEAWVANGSLCGSNLGAVDWAGKNLKRAQLERADLTGAALVRANMEGGNLRECNLSNADVESANLRNANLTGAILDGTNMYGADLRWATYDKSVVVSGGMKGGLLGAGDWRQKDLRGTELHHADLQGANLRSANLKNARLDGVNLHIANLSGADLTGASLQGATLTSCNLDGAKLRGTDLTGAVYDIETCVERGWLKGTVVGAVQWPRRDLYGAQLQGLNLEGANLDGAILADANLGGVNFKGASLVGANLELSLIHI